MRILITGDKGFVGRNLGKALRKDGHEIIGFEAETHFDQWLDKLHKLPDFDAVIHAGAIAKNQFDDPSIFLWNSYATLKLANYTRFRPQYYSKHIPFIFFSTFQVSMTQEDLRQRSWYGWSKAFAEECLHEVLPDATILRPGVMWGDEKHKGNPTDQSVPYLLATHRLKYLYRHWGRDYVHISDVVRAVKVVLRDTPLGTFNLNGEYWSNEELAELTEWDSYQLIGDPIDELGIKFNTQVSKSAADNMLSLPGWEPEACLETEFKRIEAEYNGIF